MSEYVGKNIASNSCFTVDIHLKKYLAVFYTNNCGSPADLSVYPELFELLRISLCKNKPTPEKVIIVADMYKNKGGKKNTLLALISDYLNHNKAALSKTTFQCYRTKLKSLSNWIENNHMEKDDIISFDNVTIQKFFLYLINERKLSSKTVEYYSSLVKSLFQYILDRELISINPVYNLPGPARTNDRSPHPGMQQNEVFSKSEINKDSQLFFEKQVCLKLRIPDDWFYRYGFNLKDDGRKLKERMEKYSKALLHQYVLMHVSTGQSIIDSLAGWQLENGLTESDWSVETLKKEVQRKMHLTDLIRCRKRLLNSHQLRAEMLSFFETTQEPNFNKRKNK